MANQITPIPWPPKFDTSDTGNTGFTPVAPTFPSLPTIPELSPAKQSYNADAQKFQRRYLKGFTTQELVDLDVITSARLKPGTLANRPLHRLFQSSRWERVPSWNHQRRHLYPLPNHPGMSGN
ncbi:hypothetical protein DL98DRAFT_249087 [Cadophora sp. DSE1049]|nr:hypothetical protein DL98DRAFT_249087 [Cadophora sp. DSE1049]